MATYYAKRALEIFREDGPVELAKSAKYFARKQVPLRYEIRYRNVINGIKYEAPAEPLKIYYVSPKRIQYSVDSLTAKVG